MNFKFIKFFLIISLVLLSAQFSHGQEPQFYTSGTFGDIDGDGKLDLVVSSSINIPSKAIKIFINNNNTNFVDETPTRLPDSTSEYTQKIVLADFDRDGNLDILAIN